MNGRVFIKERLNRALGNLAWCTTQTQTLLIHLPKIASDHRLILLDTHPPEARRKSLFRFQHLWISQEEFKHIIKDSWNQEDTNSTMKSWSSNLSRCEKALKYWSKEKFSNPRDQINELLRDIENLYASNQPYVQQQIDCLTAQISKLWTQDV